MGGWLTVRGLPGPVARNHLAEGIAMAAYLLARFGLTFGIVSALLLVALPFAAHAQDEPQPGQLIAVLSGDWNGDSIPDAVVVQHGQGGFADLVVLTGDGIYGLQPVVHLGDQVFVGRMAGQAPTVMARSDSSFTLHSENTGIGRSAWLQDITIAFRQGAFVVAGFTYTTYDRLDPEAGGTCDVNLLTGGFELTTARAGAMTQRGTGSERAFALSDLTDGYFPSVCKPLFEG